MRMSHKVEATCRAVVPWVCAGAKAPDSEPKLLSKAAHRRRVAQGSDRDGALADGAGLIRQGDDGAA
jgi:hypothetical protein